MNIGQNLDDQSSERPTLFREVLRHVPKLVPNSHDFFLTCLLGGTWAFLAFLTGQRDDPPKHH